MDLRFPVTNVTCRCGTLLYSWPQVEEHFARHRDEEIAMRESQARYNSLYRQMTRTC